MAEQKERGLSAEEAGLLERIQQDSSVLDELAEDLSARTRRKRQLAACVFSLAGQREPAALTPYVPALVDALDLSEAQTRWEVLDALTSLVPVCPQELSEAYEGAEDALFDEDSATLRFSAFRFFTAWGATSKERSLKAWPLIDEAIQCFHGDLEYRDMLVCLHDFASSKIDDTVAAELAGRIKFDAEHGKGASIKARSAEIYDLLLESFKLDAPKKRARTVTSADTDDEE